MNRAIFLDRDGVIIDNSDHYYIWKQDQMHLVEGIIENLQFLIRKGFLLFIVSNQGGISKGIYTKSDILQLHDDLINTFQENKISISEISFCPHHSDIEKCLCRKPGSLMIERLVAKHQINKDESYFIGDSSSDMEAAENAGIQGIQITPNQNMAPFISFLIK